MDIAFIANRIDNISTHNRETKVSHINLITVDFNSWLLRVNFMTMGCRFLQKIIISDFWLGNLNAVICDIFIICLVFLVSIF